VAKGKSEMSAQVMIVSGTNETFASPVLCFWKRREDSWSDYWNTTCGHDFVFSDGDGPRENEFTFCPFCGKKIGQVAEATE
jgi:hypothetical protein